MNTFRSLVLSGTILSLPLAGGAFAQNAPAQQPKAAASENSGKNGSPEQPRGPMARLDANKDGAIQVDEFSSTERLKAADTNGDGTLSSDEIEALVLKRMVERETRRLTNRLDVDGDGKVTLAEVENQKAKRFALMDRNNDGKLDPGELRHGKKDGKDHHGHGPKKHERHGERHQPMPKQL